jgi:lysophospholipase L1-like esterase
MGVIHSHVSQFRGFVLIGCALLLFVGLVGSVTGCAAAEKRPATKRPDTQPDTQPATTQEAEAETDLPPINPALPTLFIAGDSTAARSRSDDTQGWAVPFSNDFDPEKINVLNLARGGRSSRTFITEGWWDRLLSRVKPGDIVLIQFGHNDATAVDSPQARGSLPGVGGETQDVVNKLTGKPETVHTFGWYVRRMIVDTSAKGATPIVLSLTLHNTWRAGQIERGPGEYATWDAQLAKETGIAFVDLSALEAETFQDLGPQRMGKLYRGKTHFDPAAADLHARFVVVGLEQLPGGLVESFLSDTGRAVVKEYRDTKRLKVSD